MVVILSGTYIIIILFAEEILFEGLNNYERVIWNQGVLLYDIQQRSKLNS